MRGRSPDRSWRHSTVVLVAVGVAALAAHLAYRYAYEWSPFQRWYLTSYVYSRAAGLLFTAGDYRLLHVVRTRGSRLAVPAEVELSPQGTPTMRPTALAVQDGALRIAWVTQRYDHRGLHGVLRDVVYDGQRPIDLVRPSLWILPSALVAFVAGNVALDVGLAHWRRRVRRFRGPALVSVRTFNRRLRTTGLGLTQRPDWLARRRRRPLVLRLPAACEAQHVLIMGDAGGTAVLIAQLLAQIRARGDTAIVYDPACAQVGRFYDPGRHDVILHPRDARAPCWSPADDIETSADVAALAAALVPAHRADDTLITETARDILAHLLTSRPTARTLAAWLADREERTRRLGGVLPDVMTRAEWGDSAGRVEVRLDGVCRALRGLATPDEVSGRWSARTWAASRDGWVFLTAPPDDRAHGRFWTTVWLDLLLRYLPRTPEASSRRVWIVLDGVDTLDPLASLRTTITQTHAALTVVVACRCRSGMDALYGRVAEAILSQPAVKVFLRTADPTTAQWASDVIGRVDVEHLRASAWPFTAPASRGRELLPLLLPATLASLPPLHGYVQASNLVARLDMPAASATARHEPFVERPIPPEPPPEPPPVATRARPPDTATTEADSSAAVTVPDDDPFFQ